MELLSKVILAVLVSVFPKPSSQEDSNAQEPLCKEGVGEVMGGFIRKVEAPVEFDSSAAL